MGVPHNTPSYGFVMVGAVKIALVAAARVFPLGTNHGYQRDSVRST